MSSFTAFTGSVAPAFLTVNISGRVNSVGTQHGESLGDVIRRLRRDRGLTQEDLADRAGISQRTLSDIERGNIGLPRVENLRALAAALGVDTGDLLLASNYVQNQQAADAVTERAGGSPFDAVTSDPEMVRLLTTLSRLRLTRERIYALNRILDGYIQFDRETGHAVDEDVGHDDPAVRDAEDHRAP